MSNQELEERIQDIENRLESIENLFSSSLIDDQRSEIETTEEDAREKLNIGDVKTIKIFDPPGQGKDPDRGVGKIDGIVTFVDCTGLDVEQDDTLHCRITNVEKKTLRML